MFAVLQPEMYVLQTQTFDNKNILVLLLKEGFHQTRSIGVGISVKNYPRILIFSQIGGQEHY